MEDTAFYSVNANWEITRIGYETESRFEIISDLSLLFLVPQIDLGL